MLGSFSFWGFSKGLGAKIGLVSNGPHTVERDSVMSRDHNCVTPLVHGSALGLAPSAL